MLKDNTPLPSALEALRKKIADRSVVVGIFGLGYVGLTLALGFAEVAVGILVEDVDATNANVDVAGAAVVRHAQIAPSGLTFKVAATDAQIAAALASLRTKGILTVREA